MRDYYDILGVEPSANSGEIKRAYKKLARKYHPDVSSDPDAQTRFQDISDAYDNLKNEEKRAEYDDLRSHVNGERFQGGSDLNFDDLLSSILARSGFADHSEPLDHTLAITLEEAYGGATRDLHIDGKAGRKTIRVTEGTRLRLTGQGEPGWDGRSGDLHLRLTLAPHQQFETDGRNISLALSITPWQAALGEAIEVPTLGGTVTVTVPANSQTGQKLRLRGRGLGSGDQFVILSIANPLIASEQQRRAFEQLRSSFSVDSRAD